MNVLSDAVTETIAGALYRNQVLRWRGVSARKDTANRWVFRCRQKEASDDVDRTLRGKEFQACATRNAQSPRVDRRVDGTMSVDVLASLSWRRASTSMDRWSISERYDGARSCR